MGPESLLLIEENVLPEQGVPLESGFADLTMMVSFASLERSLAQWESLLNKAGLKLEKLWRPEGREGGGTSALLEVVKDVKDA